MFHKKWCLEKTSKYYNLEISAWFRDSPEKTVRNYEEYKMIVENPVSLGDIMERLKIGSYRWVHEWENDMNNVWKNAKLYNSEGTEPHKIACYLQRKFLKECIPIPNSIESQKARKLYIETQKLAKLLSHPPQCVKKLKWSIPDIPTTAPDTWDKLSLSVSKVDAETAERIIRVLPGL